MREWQETDIPGYAQIVADPDVMRFSARGTVHTFEQATAFVHRMPQRTHERGWIRWAVVEKATRTLMGWCGFDLRDGQVDFGYRYAKSFWGKEFGAEVAQAVLAYGMTHYPLTSCTAAVFVENTASVRILETIGFQIDHEGEYRGMQVAYDIYTRA